jgi:hypothetical protein
MFLIFTLFRNALEGSNAKISDIMELLKNIEENPENVDGVVKEFIRSQQGKILYLCVHVCKLLTIL